MFSGMRQPNNDTVIRGPRRTVAPPEITVSGIVTQVRCYKPEDHYCIVVVKGPDAHGNTRRIAIKGNAAGEIRVGMLVEATGVKSQYNNEEQIKTEFLKEKIPVTPDGIEAYLGSGVLPGIGPVLAKQMVKRWGVKTFEIIDKYPLELQRLHGVGELTQRKITEAWKLRRATAQIMAYLAGHGIGPKIALRIYNKIGDECIAKINSNPYLLTSVPMVSFLTADSVAKSMGIAPNDPFRIASYLKFHLDELGMEGDTMVLQSDLAAAAVTALKVPIEEIRAVIASEMISGTEIMARCESAGLIKTPSNEVRFYDDDFVSTRKIYNAEISVAQSIERLCSAEAQRAAKPIKLDRFDQMLEAARMSHLDPDQREAVKRTLQSKVSVITGGPGCGKTTITKGLLGVIESNKLKFKLCAPTGRAARRMAEATGKSASTAHSLLGARGATGGFLHNQNNPLDLDVLVIDEASMADTYLVSSLLKALPDRARVVLVGDSDQLPSVGAGNVLSDVMRSKAVPVSVLTKIHRQAEGNPIIQNSHSIIAGRMPARLDQNEFLIFEKKPDEIASKIGEILKVLVAGDFKREEIQVLAPMKIGKSGTVALNEMARAILNPDTGQPTVSLFGDLFRMGDRVMQIKNDRENELSNGDMGHLVGIDTDKRKVTIDFGDREVSLPFNDCGSLVIAYACTVHKSQGSEFPVVIMPMTMDHYMMLDRNIFYTAVTRAKERVYLVGESRALQTAVSFRNTQKRLTGLTRMLRDVAARLQISQGAAAEIEDQQPDYAFKRPNLNAVNF